MATIRQFPLHQNLIGGVNTSLPAHLIGDDKWRTQHNFRLTPTLEMVPRKLPATSSFTPTEVVNWLGLVPTSTPGHADVFALTPTKLYSYNTGNVIATLIDDGQYRRWGTAIYDGKLYFLNELNPLKVVQSQVVASVANAPKGKYIAFWYDHAVVGAPISFADRVQISHLYDISTWQPDAANEADYYDFVEWQQSDIPFTGVTGLGKLRGTLWVYTPTAIIPMSYVGKPKVINVNEQGIVTRNGNTFPWTLVMLDVVHFFFDFMEYMFFAFDGQTVTEIGEPVRQYLKDNLSSDLSLASRMYGYVDPQFREVWWPFCSKLSSGVFDKAVVFNYRYRKWFTASTENVHSFLNYGVIGANIGQLTGLINDVAATTQFTQPADVDWAAGTGPSAGLVAVVLYTVAPPTGCWRIRYSTDAEVSWTEVGPNTTSGSSSFVVGPFVGGTALHVQARWNNCTADASPWSATKIKTVS